MRVALFVLVIAGCSDDGSSPDGGRADAGNDGGAGSDAAAPDAGATDAGAADAARGDATLAEHRDRLMATLEGSPCASWASFDESRRAVFLTLTHRLFIARTPDGLPALAHVTRVYLVLGGGSSGETCGGAENNRLFVATDAYLHDLMVRTWNRTDELIEDGGGSRFVHTRDLAGPHDPFDASIESDVGLSCTLLIEDGDSRPPTLQAHFFVETPAAVERGDGISLPADPFMLEIDHDYDCLHRSNPTCSDFDEKYRENYGDFECEWIPAACTSTAAGCYRPVDP